MEKERGEMTKWYNFSQLIIINKKNILPRKSFCNNILF
jgi:hypothetical protein